jgi:predicted thioesterase
VTQDSLQPGIVGIATTVVDAEHTAARIAEGAVPMFSTPSMIGLMERAAFDVVEHMLPSGQTTVGTIVDIRHLGASPIGLTITARAALVEVDGRRLRFQVEASDGVEIIGDGWHERYIVDLERLTKRAQQKLQQGDASVG